MKQLAILLLVIGMLLPCFSNEETPKKRFFKKAGSELIIGTKIAFQLHKELKASGISSVELLKEVKKNPKKFLVSVPYHERTRIIAFLPEHDQIISKKAFDEYKNTIYEDIKEQKRISNVIKKLLVSCPQKVSIKIYLLKDQSINANCLSDGSIFVTKGALNNLSNKKLAALLAHELGHLMARHCAEKFTKLLMKKMGKSYFDAKALGNLNFKNKIKGHLIAATFGKISEYGFALPYERTMEYEADKIGAIILHKAGFNPKLLIDLLESMEEQNNKGDNKWYDEYLSNHPLDKKRIAKLNTVIQEITK